MEKIFIGIDVSKATLDVAVAKATGTGYQLEKKYSNEDEGCQLLLADLASLGIKSADCWFLFEHTGVYSLHLGCFLQEHDLCYSVLPALQIKKSLGITRGKNDRIDARRISEYGQLFQKKFKPSVMDSKNMMTIRELLTYRSQLVKQSTQLKNSLKPHQQMAKLTRETWITDDIAQSIVQLAEKKKSVDARIEQLIAEDESIKSNYDLIRSIKGIGPIIATFMIIYTANFTSFENGRKFACYTGVAPFEHSSGTSIHGRTQVSPLGQKGMKTLLYNGANSASRVDPELKAYYQRKRLEGKHHNLIINAIACKMVNRCFAVIKRQTPYVCLYEKKVQKSLPMS